MKSVPCPSTSSKLSATWHPSMRPLAVLGFSSCLLPVTTGRGCRVQRLRMQYHRRFQASTYTLSGTVTEVMPSGSAAVEGALVRDDNSGNQTTTDGAGFYIVAGLPATSRSELRTRLFRVVV